MKFQADWGHGETRATKVLQRLRKKCDLCGKGMSIFEKGHKYHLACYKLKMKNRRHNIEH